MIERFEFKNNTISTFDTEQNLVSYNGKEIWKLKGLMKSVCFRNKKNELDGVVIKVKDNWWRIFYLVISSEKVCMRKSLIKCFELIPTLEKDKRSRIKKVEGLKL